MSSVMLIAIPVFFITIAIDWLAGYLKGKKNYYRFADTITNLNLGVGQQAINIATKMLLLGIYDYTYKHFALLELGSSIPVIIACTILFDFIYYWAHRWAHEINFFWGAHVVHHQSEAYNLSVALRQSWFHNLIAFPLFLPLAVMGFNTLVLGGVAVFITLYQYWIHTQAIGKMHPWFEYIFNTPSHHRVHHGVNPKYIDKNHGAFLIIWDRLFGTFKAEEETPDFGITTRFLSMNPVWANFHYYVEMLQKTAQMKNWKDKLKIIVARPGWLPAYLGGFQQIKEVDKKNWPLFDANTSLSAKIYVAVQFLLIVWGLMSYMAHFDVLNWFYRLLFLAIIMMSILICGAILENKKWVIVAETVRLSLAAISIPYLYYVQFFKWFGIVLPTTVILFVVFNIWIFLNWKHEHHSRSLLRA
jgi:sterol desaturase/sphingolipid hydroxylase (fatty acid hydroxylase superfamily)